MNPMNTPTHLVEPMNPVDGGTDHRHATDGDPTGEASRTRGVVPTASPPSRPPVDLEKDGSGIPGTGSPGIPETPQNRRVLGHRLGSVPDGDGGGRHDE